MLNDWREVAVVLVAGRWFQSTLVLGKEWKRAGRLMFSWRSRWIPVVLAEIGKVDAKQPIVGPIEAMSGVRFGACIVPDCSIPNC